MIGGGIHSFIGPVHRMAARMSDRYELVAAVLSSDPQRSIQQAEQLGIHPDRAYASWEQMIQAEQEREDGIEVLSIMTPNDTHFPISQAAIQAGMHIICDKPLCNKMEEAHELLAQAGQAGIVFCVTYNYSAYPMVRQAKAMIEAGELGDIRQVHAQYIQGHLADEHAATGWRGNAEKGGPSLVVGDIATHAFHLICDVTGLEVRKLMADLGTSIPGRQVDDTLHCLLRMSNDARGSMWITNAAAGAEHGLHVKIFGSKGGLEWHQEDPNVLWHRQLNGFEQKITRRNDGKLYPAAEAATALVIGHPEGFHDAFSNLYREVAEAIDEDRRSSLPFPTVLDGAKGVQFIYQVIKSSENRAWEGCLWEEG